MTKPHQLVLLSTAIALTACANTPQSNRSILSKEHAMSQTTTETNRPIKRYNDGSTPFTMQEIEERLLKVFALPPDQVNRDSVSQAFGVFMPESNRPTYYEEISEDKKMAFTVETSTPIGPNIIFEYSMFLKTEVNGEGRMLSDPKVIPDAYKIPYLPFAKKLEERGWKFKGRSYVYGVFRNRFQNPEYPGYSMSLHIDVFKKTGDEFDHSNTKISSIMIETIPTYNK